MNNNMGKLLQLSLITPCYHAISFTILLPCCNVKCNHLKYFRHFIDTINLANILVWLGNLADFQARQPSRDCKNTKHNY